MSFRGASADAVSALTDELAPVATSANAATVSADLFAAATTLRGEAALRRFATDSSIPAAAKTGLFTEVFGSKVDAGSLSLLTSAVARRWTAGRDLPDALEHLGVMASVIAAGSQTSRLADELFAFAQAVKDNPELRDALADPLRSDADKRGLVATILTGALPSTLALAGEALSGSHRTVAVALAEYQKVVADAQTQGVATVRVARALSEADLQRLGTALAAQYGRPVHLNQLVDPSVLGGIRVEIGDDVIDGTVSSRLDDARRRLVG